MELRSPLSSAVVALAVVASPLAVAAGEVHRLLQEGASDKALALLANDATLINAVDDLQQTPLHVAAHRGRLEVVKWLIAKGAKVNAAAYNGFTPLHLAQDGEIAKALIAGGADLDHVDNWGDTPLQKAASYKHQAVVDAILATGKKLDLSTAVMLQRVDLVERMLMEDPAIAKQPTKGSGLWGSKTPLGLAASQRDRRVVQLLLNAGANVNETTSMPNAGGDATALTNAVWAGDKEIVELLLKHGAKTDVVGGKFYPTILDYARKHSSPEIVALLEQAQKNTDR